MYDMRRWDGGSLGLVSGIVALRCRGGEYGEVCYSESHHLDCRYVSSLNVDVAGAFTALVCAILSQ